jgi:RES domain-containing protein
MFKEVTAKLKTLKPSPLKGVAFRAVNLRYISTPFSAIGSFRMGGRYNPKGAFEVLYLAENATTTLLEVEFSASSDGKFKAQPKDPFVVFSIHFNLQRVVNLQDPVTLSKLGLRVTDLTQPWRLKHLQGKPILTHAIGQKLLELKYEAFKYPSATDGNTNLAVLPSNLRKGSFLEIGFEDKVLARMP